jgi:hypothetical protein
MARIETVAALEQADEHFLAGVHGLVLIAQQTAAPPEDHRPVTLAEPLDVQRPAAHATPSTPKNPGSVTY